MPNVSNNGSSNQTGEQNNNSGQNGTGQQNQNAGNDNAGQNANNSQQPEKTFTQADVNRLIRKERRKFEQNAGAHANSQTSQNSQTGANNSNSQSPSAAETELNALRSSLRDRDAKDDLTTFAKTAELNNPDLVFALYKDELEFDSKGKVTNAKEVCEIAKAERPALFGTVAPNDSINSNSGNSSGKTVSMNDLIRRAAGRA